MAADSVLWLPQEWSSGVIPHVLALGGWWRVQTVKTYCSLCQVQADWLLFSSQRAQLSSGRPWWGPRRESGSNTFRPGCRAGSSGCGDPAVWELHKPVAFVTLTGWSIEPRDGFSSVSWSFRAASHSCHAGSPTPISRPSHQLLSQLHGSLKTASAAQTDKPQPVFSSATQECVGHGGSGSSTLSSRHTSPASSHIPVWALVSAAISSHPVAPRPPSQLGFSLCSVGTPAYNRISYLWWQIHTLGLKLTGTSREFPGGPVTKTSGSHCRGHRFSPW